MTADVVFCFFLSLLASCPWTKVHNIYSEHDNCIYFAVKKDTICSIPPPSSPNQSLPRRSSGQCVEVKAPTNPRAPLLPPLHARRAAGSHDDILRAPAPALRRRRTEPGDGLGRPPGPQRPLGGGGAVQRAQAGSLRFRNQPRGPAGHARAAALSGGQSGRGAEIAAVRAG